MLLINSQPVDYDANDLLPFVMRFRTDDFWAFGTSVGNELVNITNRITLPLTPNNRAVLTNDRMPFKAVLDGQTTFEGECMITERIQSMGGEQVALAVYGGNFQLFAALDGVQLNKLSLGSQVWSNLAIRDTWLAASTAKGVFAPVIYGQLSPSLPPLSDEIVEWRPSDMRFAVYFRAIVDAIASEVGYRIVSDFMDTDYFKSIVFLYSVGASPKVADPLRVDSFLTTAQPIVLNETNLFFSGAIDTNTATYPQGLLDEMTIEFDGDNAANSWALPSGDAFRMGKNGEVEIDTYIATSVPNRYRVRISKNSLETVAEFPTDQRNITTVTVENGDTLQVKLTSNQPNASGGNILVAKTYFRINSRVAAVNEVFDVASCLPAVAARTFMRDLTRMFNLAWRIDKGTRTISVEPRFDNPLTRGWYHSPSYVQPRVLQLSADKTVTHDEQLNASLVFQHNDSDDPLIELFAERQSSRLEIGAVRAEIGESERRVSLELFEAMPMASVQNAAMSASVPALLPSDTDLVRMEAMPQPTFKSGYRCALVQRDGVTAAYNGTIVAMPRLAATNAVGGVCLTWESGANGLGLVEAFYRKQLRMLPKNSTLSSEALMPRNTLVGEDFRRLVGENGQVWALMQVEANMDTDEAAKVRLARISFADPDTPLTDNRIASDYVFAFPITTP